MLRMLTADFWMLGTSYRMLGAGYFMLGTGFGVLGAKTTGKKPNQELFLFSLRFSRASSDQLSFAAFCAFFLRLRAA